MEVCFQVVNCQIRKDNNCCLHLLALHIFRFLDKLVFVRPSQQFVRLSSQTHLRSSSRGQRKSFAVRRVGRILMYDFDEMEVLYLVLGTSQSILFSDGKG